MREILFRAKRIDNGEWVEGSFIDSGNHEQVFIYPHYDGASTMPCRSLVYHRMIAVDPNTICQYTGLTDKAGNKIWENDLLLLEDRIVRIEWWKHSAGFDCIFEKSLDNKMNTPFRGIYPQQYKHYEVIGNIFDNADLLKGE